MGKRQQQKTASKAQLASRLAIVEEMMVRRVSSHVIDTELAARWGVSQRTMARYREKVSKAWAHEASKLDRSDKRNHLERTLEHVLNSALTRRVVVRDADGNPVMRTGPDGKKHPVTFEQPDLRAANTSVHMLMRLHGLDKVSVEHGAAENIVELLKMGEALNASDATKFAIDTFGEDVDLTKPPVRLRALTKASGE